MSTPGNISGDCVADLPQFLKEMDEQWVRVLVPSHRRSYDHISEKLSPPGHTVRRVQCCVFSSLLGRTEQRGAAQTGQTSLRFDVRDASLSK